MANLVDDPSVERVVFFHGGRWVDGNGNVVEDHKKYRRQMRDATPNAPVVHDAPDDDLDDDELDEDMEEGTDYSKMTVTQLQAEIASRNEDRDEEDKIVPADNKKPQLVQALQDDDEESEDDEEE